MEIRLFREGRNMSTSADRKPVWGFAAFLFGVFSLVAVTLHVSGAVSEPKQSAASQVGQIAAEIRQSAMRALAGEEPPMAPTQSSGWSADRFLLFAVPALACVAAVLGAVGLFRHEAPALPGIGIVMGCSAFVMQYVLWLSLIIGGICLLIFIVRNLDSIFES